MGLQGKELNDTVSIMETNQRNAMLQLLIFTNENIVILCINYPRKEMSVTFGDIYFCMSDHCSKYWEKQWKYIERTSRLQSQ